MFMQSRLPLRKDAPLSQPSSKGRVAMPNPTPAENNDMALRRLALARWENEGGTPRPIDRLHSERIAEQKIPALTDTEIIALRVRVIALENLMIALSGTASDPQFELPPHMISYLSPGTGDGAPFL